MAHGRDWPRSFALRHKRSQPLRRYHATDKLSRLGLRSRCLDLDELVERKVVGCHASVVHLLEAHDDRVSVAGFGNRGHSPSARHNHAALSAHENATAMRGGASKHARLLEPVRLRPHDAHHRSAANHVCVHLTMAALTTHMLAAPASAPMGVRWCALWHDRVR